MIGQSIGRNAAVALLVAGAVLILPHGDVLRPGTVPPFLAGMAVMMAGYLLALRSGAVGAVTFWTIAAGLRLLLLAQDPGNDIYRYLWEGRVLASGVNPYLHAPNAPELMALRDVLWPKINHPEATAIYPPLSQLLFALMISLGGGVTAFKTCFALGDLAVCGILGQKFGPGRALVYAWNPLVIHSFSGGGHYDSLFVLFLVAAWLAWDAGSARTRAAILLGGTAVALKWIAAPVVAWMLWQRWRSGEGWWRTGMLIGIGALPFVLAWLVVCLMSGEWTARLAPVNFARLARSAALLPSFADAITGRTVWNEMFALPMLIAWGWVVGHGRTLERAAEWSYFAAFVGSPMLHAWYFPWILPFAAATGNRGSIALNVTGVIYYLLPHRAALGEPWILPWWAYGLLWIPFLVGFLGSRCRSPSP